MAVNIGDAQISLTIDLSKLDDSLKQVSSQIQASFDQMKQGLDFNADAFSGVQSSLTGIDSTAKQTGDSVRELGERGTDSIGKLMKFEIVSGVMSGVQQAFNSVKGIVMDTAKEFAGAELSAEKLKGGLTRLGEGAYYDRLIQQANELHKITPFDDNDITNMQAMLTTFNGITGEAIERLTPAMLNLSSAFAEAGDTGMGLTQIAIMVGKAGAAEMEAAFTRVGIVMSDTQKAMWDTMTTAERFTAIEKILAHNSNITADAFGKTLAGQIKITENAFGDIKETIGKAFDPVLRGVMDIVQKVSDIFQQLPEELQAAVGGIVAVTVAVTALIPVLIALDVELAGIPIIIGTLVVAMGALYELFTNFDSIQTFVTDLLGGQEAVMELKQGAEELWQSLQDLWDTVTNELSVAFSDIKDQMLEVWQGFLDMIGGSDNLFNTLKQLANDGFKYLTNVILTIIDTVSRVITVVNETTLSNQKWLGGVKQTGDGYSSFKLILDAAVGGIEIMISTVGRAIEVMYGLYNALVGIGSLNIYDLIFDKSKFDANLDKFKLGLNQLENAFKSSVQRINQGNEINPVQGPRLDRPMIDKANIKDYEKGTTPPGGKSKEGSESGSQSDPYKEENEQIKNLIAQYENLLKLEDDKIARHESTLEARNQIVNTYLSELQALTDLQNEDNRTKVELKISDLLTAQYKQLEKAGEEQRKLSDEVGKFIDKRTEKTLSGVAKETTDIENAYKTMYEKIEKSAIDATEKEFLKKQLDVKREEELRLSSVKFREQLDNELKAAEYRNVDDTYNYEVMNINAKYDKEKKRIEDTYKEGEKRSALLQQVEIARIRELERVHTEGEQNILNMINAGFTASANVIKAEFTKVWESIFGQANSLFEIFIARVWEALMELAATSILRFILNFASGSLFSFAGAGQGGGSFAVGTSYTGDGPESEIAGVVHYKEAVMNAMGAQFPFNRAIVDMANQGVDLSEFFTVPDIQMPVINLPDGITTSSGSSSLQVNLGGIAANINALKLNDKDWIDIVDNDLMPQISKGLKRIGKEVLDNTINN